MTEKHKKASLALNYFEHFLVFVSAVSGRVLIPAVDSLVGVPVGIANSGVGLKICTITVGIKKYKPDVKNKNKKHNKIMLLAKTKLKTKLNTIEVLISKILID